MQIFPNNWSLRWTQGCAIQPTVLVHLGCCVVLVLFVAASVDCSLETCCFGMNAQQATVRSNFEPFFATHEPSRSQEQTPAPSTPIHCAMCHAIGQIALLAGGFSVVLALTAALVLPNGRAPRCLLLAPTPPPPRVA